MTGRGPIRSLAVVTVALLGACADGGEPTAAPPSTTSTSIPRTTTTTSSTTTTTAPTTTTTWPSERLVPGVRVEWPALPTDTVAAVVTPTGIPLPAHGQDGGRFVVTTPCAQTASVPGSPLAGAHVVIDAGHGGDEPGAVGRVTGLTEKEVNLAIALEIERLLEEAGAVVVLTRTADYRITLATRGELATALRPLAFVSIHHNAEPDGPWPGPGSEMYYQIASADSKRLAGLVWEEVTAAFATFQGVDWVADTDAGAKYRVTDSGGDYYGILRRTAGLPAVLSEAAFISNPPEEALLATDGFRRAEATAVARAIVRFVGTTDPGSGFTDPYPRTQPAGPGGGTSGCVDPPLE